MRAATSTCQETLHVQLAQARADTDALWDVIRPDALFERPIPERHRLIFYLGHLEAFDWNMIARRGLNAPSFHPAFDQLFEFGIDPEPGALPQDSAADWPAEEEVWVYNRRARATLDRLLPDAPREIVEAAIEHRLMHAETLAYLLHNLAYSAKVPVSAASARPGSCIENSLIEIPAGPATLGKEVDEIFGWDNEFRRHTVEVPAFRCGQYKVTNGEYLKFVLAGARAPYFWLQQGDQWFYRGMFALVPLPLQNPVYVTQQEAVAYANWRGQTLLTEPQFHRLAEAMPGAGGNFDFRTWDPLPVNETAPLIGNGWEWTRTVFAPFASFEPCSYYPGYSANFFDGRHYVLKGASPRTAARFLRPSFRNWFRADYPYAYASFRVVEKSA